MSVSRTDQGAGVRQHVPTSSDGGPFDALLTGDSLTRRCLELAGDLGFARAGVASLEPFDQEIEQLEAFLAQGRAGEMEYLGTRSATGELLRSAPRLLFADAKCAEENGNT